MKTIFALILSLGLMACDPSDVAVDNLDSGQTYTYRLKISGYNTDYHIDVYSNDESLDVDRTLVGTTQIQDIVSGSYLQGTITRVNGTGHLSIVILRDGINIFQTSITVPSDSIDIGTL